MSDKQKNKEQRTEPQLAHTTTDRANIPVQNTAPQKPIPNASNKQPTQAKQWLSRFCKLIITLLIVVIIALAGLWIWSARDGSLAQTISLVQQFVPDVQNSLQVEDVRGSLRRGGSIRSLRWQQDNINVQLTGIDLSWNLNTLFSRKLIIEHAIADAVYVNILPSDTPAEPETPTSSPSVPPANLSIPIITADLNLLKVNTFIFGEEESALYVKDIQANYHYDHTNHQLGAQLTAVLESIVPGSDQHARVNATVNVQGLLTELHITANAQATILHDAQEAAEKTSPEALNAKTTQTAHLSATLTPWDSLILPQADLSLQDLNMALFWPQAPQTLLTGEAHVTSSESISSPIGALHVLAEIKNTHPGALNEQFLPISEVKVNANWDNRTATLELLDILIGDKGSIVATGFAQFPSDQASNTQPLADAEIKVNEVNPHNILSTLGNDRINGSLNLNYKTEGLFYNITLKALNAASNRTATPKIQSIVAHGNIIAETLALEELHIKTSNSDIKGQATYRLPIKLLAALASDEEVDISQSFEHGVANARLDLNAPGITAHLNAKQLSASAGTLLVDLKAPETQKTLAWIQKIPFVPAMVHDYMTHGGLDLQAQAEGGWLDPQLNATLASPELIVSQRKMPEISAAATTSNAATSFTDLINMKSTLITINGRMSNATLNAQTSATIEQQIIGLNLQAQGGFKDDIVKARFDQLEAVLSQIPKTPPKSLSTTEPKTVVNVDIENPVDLSWNNNNGLLTVSPGSLKIKFADKADQAPSLTWEKTTWQAGALDTSGSLTAFPALWLTTFVESDLSDLDLGGDLMIEGNWRVHMGSKLDFLVEVMRTSGDLTLESSASAFSSVTSANSFQAGVKEARLKAFNEGDNLHLEVVWDTERASIIYINLNTLLSKIDGVWTIKPNAPLSGQVIAQLPEIGITSAVAPTGWRFGGAAILDSELHGTLSTPYLKGRLSAMGVSLRSVIDGISFADGKMEIMFDENQVRMEELSLRGAGSDGGSLNATGLVDWSNGELPTVELNLVIDKLKASVHSDRQLTTSGKLTMSLKDQALDITGNVLVDRALIIIGGTGAPLLDSDVVILTEGKQTNTTEKEKGPNPLEKLGIIPNIKVTLDMGKNLRVQGFGLQTYLQGELALSNQGWSPTLIGKIDTVDGRFKAYGQHLIVENGTIIFTGLIDNPTLSILAIRANTSERVGIHITGTASHPSIKLYSESGMTDSETLSWLVLGRPSSADGAEMAVLQQAALALISGEGEGLTDQLAGALGIDEISFGGSSSKKTGSSDDSVADATITIGKRLSDDFYVSYEQGLTGAMGTFYVFYDISRRLTLRAEAGEFTALDLIYSFRFDGKK